MDQTLIAQAHALLQRNQLDAAFERLMPALDEDQALPLSLKLLLRLALQTGRMEVAVRAMRRAIALLPQDAEVHALAAAGAKIVGNGEGLERSARRALQLDAAQPLATALLVERLGERLDFSEALKVADAYLSHAPRDWGVRLARANIQLFSGDAAAAAEDADTAARESSSMQARQTALSSLLYMDAVAAEPALARHVALASQIEPWALPPSPRQDRGNGRPLRIGLLSADLRMHPVGLLLEPLLRAHDRDRAGLFCYHDGAPDPQTERLQAACPQWRDVRGQPDGAVARQMHEDGIDVLVDLAGHTAGSRTRLLASRVAQLQVGYLGYLFDTGFESNDGVVGDHWTLPADTRSARNPLRMGGSFLCFATPVDAPPVAARRSGVPTFASFNHLAKLSPATLQLWARVLAAVPDSRLLLCALGLADAGVRHKLGERLAAQGIDPSRVELRPPVLDTPAFLRMYDEVDIALDPLPFNGGMTTLNALWQGVPVITLPGERMASRTGASILSAIGMESCIASSEHDYVAIAAQLASESRLLIDFRASVRDRLAASSLMDAQAFADRFCRLLEDACTVR